MKQTKKTIVLITLLLLVLGYCSCKKTTVNTEKTGTDETVEQCYTEYKSYNYGIIGGDYIISNDSGPIKKYNVHNGKVSYLCPDPFCKHDDNNCQFYDLLSWAFTSIGNTVYYVRQNEATGSSTLYSFDIITSETKELYISNEYMTNVYAYEHKLLIYCILNYGINISGCYFWYDVETGITEELKADMSFSNYVYEIRDDRIIWGSSNENKYYSTDLKGADYREHDYGYRYGNHYTIESEKTEDGRVVYNLYATFPSKEKRTLLLEGVGPCLFYENKIVYFKSLPKNERVVVHVDEDGKQIKAPYSGDVYVMNPDGTNNHILFHTDEFIIGTTANRAHPQICGDYIGIIVGNFDGDNMLNDKLIIANINTGEFVVTHD